MYLYLYRWCGILVIPGFLQLSVQQIPFVRNIVVQIGYGWTGNLAEENKCIKREQEGNETMTNCHTLANNLYQAWWERWPHARSRVFRFRASALSAFHENEETRTRVGRVRGDKLSPDRNAYPNGET